MSKRAYEHAAVLLQQVSAFVDNIETLDSYGASNEGELNALKEFANDCRAFDTLPAAKTGVEHGDLLSPVRSADMIVIAHVLETLPGDLHERAVQTLLKHCRYLAIGSHFPHNGLPVDRILYTGFCMVPYACDKRLHFYCLLLGNLK